MFIGAILPFLTHYFTLLDFRMKYLWIISLSVVYLLTGCNSPTASTHADESHQSHAEEDVHSHAGEDAHSHASDPQKDDAHAEDENAEEEAALTQEQIEKIGLTLGGFSGKNLSSVLKVNGVLAIPPQNKALVSGLMPGQVNRIFVKPGQYVKKGTTLANLQNPDFLDMQQAFMETSASLDFLEKEYARQNALLSKEIAATKQVEKVKSELLIARSKKQALSKKLRMLGLSLTGDSPELLSYIPVRSPISGFIGEIHTNIGAYTDPTEPMFEIVDNHHIHLDLKVFEKDLPYLKIGQNIQFGLQSNPSLLRTARVFSLGKALHEDDRTVTVHAEMDNKDQSLLPGMYVEARIVLENRKVRSLPESAITFDKGLEYIFVKEDTHGDETHFKKVQVLTGSRDIGFVEITPLDPLDPGAQVVTKGAFFLMAQTKKDEGGGGHHH